MEQYRTYLRAELRKLRNIGDSREFLAAAGRRVERFGLVNYDSWLAARFARPEDVDAYVRGLDPAALQDLTACCDRWRKNNISVDLSPDQRTSFVEVPVSAILLRPAEPCLSHAFERNGWLLTAIASDPEVLSSPGYADHHRGDKVEFPVCLAHEEPGRPGMYRVIDGMHRAIQLCRNSDTHIRMCLIIA